MAYSPGDKIFAKVKGHPHWPSRINLLPPDVSVPKGKYPIFFYGTHEVYFLAPKDIYPYEKFKHKYGIPRSKALFQAGLREIEEEPDVLLYGKDPQSEDFLARFYKFTRNAASQKQGQIETPSVSTTQTTNNQSGKRASTSSPAECPKPAKRPHVESTSLSVSRGKKKTSPAVQPSTTTPKKRTRRTPITPKPDSAPPTDETPISQCLTVQTGPQTDSSSARPKRLASLRLRIRNDGNGLKFSPAHMSPQSSPLSPSTTGSNGTVEAKGTVEVITTPPATNAPDPLRITIKQLSTSPSIVVTPSLAPSSTLVSTRPVFSVSPSSGTGLIGVGTDSNLNLQRKKSTAVVTPLRRDSTQPPLGISDESTAESTPGTEAETPSSRTPSDQRFITTAKPKNSPRRNMPTTKNRHTHGDHKESRHKKDTSKLSGSVTATTTPTSEHDSISTQSPWLSNECEKSSEVACDRIDVASPQSTKTTPQNLTLVQADGPAVVEARLKELIEIGKEQKEQQLKDLDTEARLLLIDRSIKSSLVRDHEDIATCVDRLAVLDRMIISLPVLAKCWTVVETIRKCRRYKRSLEVKIAAQKVFNKFLQLYATADKCELDLAHGELVRHQQRYVRQHSGSGQSDCNMKSTAIPPYTGPKSMAELFQVSLSERRQPSSDTKDVHSVSSMAPVKSVDQVNLDSNKAPTLTKPVSHSNNRCYSKPASELLPVGFSVSDIPLPEESLNEPHTRPSSSCPEPTEAPPAVENGEEEFEVLDEYEEAGDVKNAPGSVASNSLAYPTPPATSTLGTSDYVPVSYVAYNVIQPQFMPTPTFSNMSTVTSDAVAVSPSTTMGGFASSNAVIPHYSAPYAIPYGYGCLPGSSFTQTIQNPLQPTPYTPLASAVSCSVAGSSCYSVPVEATPPQSTSRAYIPHALHPPTDPPPPYRPYVPSHCETDQSTVDPSTVLSPRPSKDIQSDGNSIRHSGSSGRRVPVPSPSSPVRRPSSNSISNRPESDRHSRNNRSNTDRRFRSPPHRARSPHALPHPLEHYQRCLTTALSSDEDRPSGSSERGWSDETVLKHPSHVAYVNTDDLLTRPDSDDLDTRIARLIGQAARTHQTTKTYGPIRPSDARKSNNPLGSPPPPPPPLPTSQRILFTHRPPANQTVSSRNLYHKSSRPVANSAFSSFSNEQCRTSSGAARRGIPPHTPDSPPVRRPVDVDHRLNNLASTSADHNESNSGSTSRRPPGSFSSDDSVLSTSMFPSASRALPTAYTDRPVESVRSSDRPKISSVRFDTPAAPVHPDPSNSSSKLGHDEDREIYSMLGV